MTKILFPLKRIFNNFSKFINLKDSAKISFKLWRLLMVCPLPLECSYFDILPNVCLSFNIQAKYKQIEIGAMSICNCLGSLFWN